jgi:RNA polymerase sigma-70 factor (ECF subfamily)
VVTSPDEDFAVRTDPFRRELLVHCYRMLGSVHDAEDMVQETYLRAWRAYERYDDRRASLRTWLYRIATNACLNAIESRSRRPLPSGLGAPSEDPEQPLVPGWEVPWLQPFPDGLLDADRGDPAGALAVRGTLRLAFVAAVQLLPARQRAVLLLRDVLEFPAAEVAGLLDTTTAAVNSALQRARARLADASLTQDGSLTGSATGVDEPTDPERRALIDRYVKAFEDADIATLTTLLTHDAILEMPPFLTWYVGRELYTRFLARIFALRGADWRMRPTGANGQPTVAAYVRDDGGTYRLHTLQVFTVTVSGISRTTVFQDPDVFAAFGLPPHLSPL